MNVKRFTARTSRDALALVREAFGDEAVVLSTRPCPQGVEILAMAPDGMQQIARVQAPVVSAPHAPHAPHASHAADAPRVRQPLSATADAAPATSVQQDVEKLSMSTLSFQDYVRERMLRRRKAQLSEAADSQLAGAAPDAMSAAAGANLSPTAGERRAATPAPAVPRMPPASVAEALGAVHTRQPVDSPESAPLSTRLHDPSFDAAAASAARLPATPVLAPQPGLPSMAPMSMSIPGAMGQVPAAWRQAPSETAIAAAANVSVDASSTLLREQVEMMSELRSVKGLIEERFGALAFLEKLQREPRQAQLSQKLLDAGFSPAMCRRLSDGLPADVDGIAWAAGVLERNLITGEKETPIEDAGGVYAMVGSTGVGKTTSTAKLAAAFAARHGAGNLGLITLDAYRIAAHEQLRAYGRILGVPVHTAHDRASLEDLLDLLAGKKMVLIDTAGMPQRDARTRELLDMLGHRAIQRLLVVNAAAQGETIEDVLVAYRAQQCRGVILSKLDESMKVGPALDAVIRHKVKVLAVANGQRVPEDWHRLSAATLVQRALRAGGSGAAWKLDANDVNLVLAGKPTAGGRSNAAPMPF